MDLQLTMLWDQKIIYFLIIYLHVRHAEKELSIHILVLQLTSKYHIHNTNINCQAIQERRFL